MALFTGQSNIIIWTEISCNTRESAWLCVDRMCPSKPGANCSNCCWCHRFSRLHCIAKVQAIWTRCTLTLNLPKWLASQCRFCMAFALLALLLGLFCALSAQTRPKICAPWRHAFRRQCCLARHWKSKCGSIPTKLCCSKQRWVKRTQNSPQLQQKIAGERNRKSGCFRGMHWTERTCSRGNCPQRCIETTANSKISGSVQKNGRGVGHASGCFEGCGCRDSLWNWLPRQTSCWQIQ